MATAVAPGASSPPLGAVAGAGGGAGAGAAGCGPRELVLKHSERQWKQRGDGAWAVHNVVDGAALQAEMEAQAGTKASADIDTVDTGVAKVKVHNMSNGSVIEVEVKSDDKAIAVKVKACKAVGIKLGAATFVCMGREVEDSVPVATIVAAGAVMALVATASELVWDPSYKTSTVTVSDNGKTMTITPEQTSYCTERNQVRSKDPVPTAGDYTFKIQNGKECGCYDAVALVPGSYDIVNNTQKLGNPGCGFAYEMCNGSRLCDGRRDYIPPGYIAEQCVMEFLYSPSAGTLSLRAARRDGTYLGEEGDNFHVVITDLPSEPLYVAVNICGHRRRNSMRIIDDSSTPMTQEEFEALCSSANNDDEW